MQPKPSWSIPEAVADAFNPDPAGTAMIQGRLERMVARATRTFLDAVEAEIGRLMPLWPAEMGEPMLVWGANSVFMGLGPAVRIGDVAVIVLPARKIVLEVVEHG